MSKDMYDNEMPPWEVEEAERVKKLKKDFLERERKKKEEEGRRKKLEESKISQAEEQQLEKKAEAIKQLYALDYWMRCFNRVSYCNEISGQALFHVCLGQALNTFKIFLDDDSAIDWRLHYLWIQDSGSGKGRAMNFVNKIFKNSKFLKIEHFDDKLPAAKRTYLTHKLGRMNAASLINTYKLDKKGLIETDDNGVEQVKRGIVASNDFIFSEEGRVLLESSRESFELQEIIMTGMETIGSSNNVYTKQLTNYEKPCETRCSASFAVTTRPFGKVKQTLVESGMIQRFMFFPRKLTFEEREEMNKLSSFAFKMKDEKTPFRKEFDLLLSEIKKVIEFAHDNYIDFNENKIDELLSFLHEKMMWFTRDVEHSVPSENNRYILQSFVSRFKENMVVMAFHSAAMRYSKIVEKQDLQYAYDFFKLLYESQKIWVSLSVEEDKDSKQEDTRMKMEIKRVLKKDRNDTTTLTELVKHMAKEFDKDYNAMRYHIMKFTKGSNRFIKLTNTNERSPIVTLD